MEKKKTRYINIDLSNMAKDTSIEEAAVLSHIISLSKERGYCFASNKAICDTLNIADRTLYRILNKLEERGSISRKTRFAGKRGRERRIYPVATATVAE